jgi:hypothetical protein
MCRKHDSSIFRGETEADSDAVPIALSILRARNLTKRPLVLDEEDVGESEAPAMAS